MPKPTTSAGLLLAALRPALDSGLSARKFALLVAIVSRPASTRYADLIAPTGIPNKPGITRALDKLEASGLTLREASGADRRRRDIVPTIAGRTLVNKALRALGLEASTVSARRAPAKPVILTTGSAA